MRQVSEGGQNVPWQFQSTHSLRSATSRRGRAKRPTGVSIHALLAECDALADLDMIDMWVSIHALLAECDDAGETLTGAVYVSIHALLAECDRRQVGVQLGTDCFNPRTPCGVRRIFD